jgi:hypothetical protein
MIKLWHSRIKYHQIMFDDKKYGLIELNSNYGIKWILAIINYQKITKNL